MYEIGGQDGCDGSLGIYFVYQTQMTYITKEQKTMKQIFPEQKTKKSFASHHLCPVHEILTGIWNPLISAQIVNSGKVYI